MPAWIECPECRVEFRDKPGRTKCPECGARVESEREDDDRDDEPVRRRRKAKPRSKATMWAAIGVGVLAVGFVVVMVLLLLGGTKADPSKVTVVNFKKLNAGMTQGEAEKILAGSSSSSVQDMQTEVSRAFGQLQGWQEGIIVQALTGLGTWRRWDGPGLIVWGKFNEPLGGGKEQLVFSMALEKLANGGHTQHYGVQALGGLFNGFPFGPGQPPFPNMPQPQFPPFPK